MNSNSRFAGSCCCSLAIAAVLAIASQASGQLVISAISGNGGSSAACPNGDFVEIFNRSCAIINLDGYSVQVSSNTGTTWGVVNLPAFNLAPGQYYAVRLQTTATGVDYIADFTASPAVTTLLTATGKAAIVLGNTALTGACPNAGTPIVDFVRYQVESVATTLCTEGFVADSTGVSTANGGGMKRLDEGCTDSNNNRNDFFAVTATLLPRNSADATNVCVPQADPNWGACVNVPPSADCIILTAGECETAGGEYQGDCTNCPLPGACCQANGVCVLAQEAACLAVPGQTYAGNGSDCASNPCVTGACCQPDGSCALRTLAGCTACYSGDGSTCDTGAQIVSFSENFDGEVVPALPAGWTATNAAGPAPLWVTSDAGTPVPPADTAPNAAFINDPAGVTDKRLDSPSIPIGQSGGVLTFQNNWLLETGFDGGVLEISINNDPFVDIIVAGGSFQSGGYNGTISTAFASPIGGRQAWTGTSSGFVTTIVDLPVAAAGQSIVLRWRMASDSSVAGTGWRIDTISLSTPTCPTVACGACCNSGSCTVTTLALCQAQSGGFQGAGTTCPNPVCAPSGACCLGTGCTIQEAATCNTAGGVYSGDGVNCTSPAPCQAPCCKSNGTCDLRTIASCNTFAGAVAGTLGTACPPAPCAPTGTCCAADATCTGPVTEAACTASGGVFWTPGGTCAGPSPCQGRCCVAGNCSVTLPNACAGAFTLGLDCTATSVVTFEPLVVPIPESGGGFVQNIQNVSGLPSPISDLDVDVKINHTWFGDLIVIVEHDGISVTIIDRPGVPVLSTVGCAADNPDLILDDEGVSLVEDLCGATTVPPSPPNYIPNNALSAFDGMNPNGDWTISVSDNAGGDTGTLVRWSLHVGTDAPVCPTGGCTCRGDVNGDGSVNGGDVNLFAQCVASGGAGCACADMNNSGTATSADIPAFVTAVITGNCGP